MSPSLGTGFQIGLAGLAALAFAACSQGNEQQSLPINPEDYRDLAPTPDREITYTSSLGREFAIYVFEADRVDDAPAPAIVMYHGGGWRAGTPDQFYRQAQVWNQLGITVIGPVYALDRTHGANPWQSLEDAFLSWQAIHRAADELGIDPDAIAAGGGSAGGHLAAALATVEPPQSVSGHRPPVALALFNPVVDNSPEGYAADRIGSDWERFSPFHNIGVSHPPTLFLLGTHDQLIPVHTGEAYCDQVRATGSDCELIIYPEALHGWFNRVGFTDTLRHSTEFLAEVFERPVPEFVDNRRVDAFLLMDDGEGNYAPIAERSPHVAPNTHEAGGPLYRYQGPVIEGEAFGVRAYFDERARFDVFNKTASDLVLRDARNDYHDMADWGRDTLFVGETLGFATPAILTAGGPEVPANLERRSVRVSTSDQISRFVLGYHGWEAGGAVFEAEHTVVMRAGTDHVEHRLVFEGVPPDRLVTGLARHEAGAVRTGQVGQVSYLLTYGNQSDQNRGLGMAIVYPSSVGQDIPEDEVSHLVALVIDPDTQTARYWATADWALDPDFAPDIETFELKVRELSREAAEAWLPAE